MIDMDLSSAAGIGAAVAAVAWLIIQRVLKPLACLWTRYVSWPESAKTALWSGLIMVAAGAWAWSLCRSWQDVFIAVAVSLTTGSGIQSTSKLRTEDANGR